MFKFRKRFDVVSLVMNPVYRDARVLKQAKSLQSAGYSIICLGLANKDRPESTEIYDDILIYRPSAKSSNRAVFYFGVSLICLSMLFVFFYLSLHPLDSNYFTSLFKKFEFYGLLILNASFEFLNASFEFIPGFLFVVLLYSVFKMLFTFPRLPEMDEIGNKKDKKEGPNSTTYEYLKVLLVSLEKLVSLIYRSPAHLELRLGHIRTIF